jgi:hypothetical protein
MLNEQTMQMAKELAREMVRIDQEKEREQTRKAIDDVKNMISGACNVVGVFSLEVGKAFRSIFGER